jgi:Kef-type K+ transport system membrane component KefB
VASRLAVSYLILFALSAGIAATSFALGSDRKPRPKIAGIYRSSDCGPQLALKQSGEFVDASGGLSGELRFRHGRLTGTADCNGRSGPLEVRQAGKQLVGTFGGRPFRATFLRDIPSPTAGAAKPPANDRVFGRLMLAIAVVILAARFTAAAIRRLGQPPVMGEVLAGILLGPTLLGAVWPALQHYLFPPFVVPLLSGAADIGLVFYLFIVGLELDPRLLRGRIGHAAAISNASIILPLGLGILAALPLYTLLGTPDKSFAAFALFMGVAMSITAFPVLARILIERRMLRQPIGALALSAAAVDDVTAWGLLAIASGIAGRGSALHALPVLGYVFAFCAVMALLAKPLLNRVSAAYDEAGRIPAGWIAAIFVGILLSAYATMKAGVAPIFGAFVVGLIMPRRADLSHDVTRRLEDFVTTVLLPLFFVVTGLKTDVGLLNRPELWLIGLGILAVAIVGKWVGAAVTARVAGYSRRDSAVLGTLMNTRGLTELIVLNIGFELGVISSALFTMLVLMALVTTFMAAPLLRALDPRRELSAPVEEELPPAEPEPTIVVAPLEERNADELLALAEPLARSDPPRSLLLVRLLPPPRVTAAWASQDRELERERRELDRFVAALTARGLAARSVALISADRGGDLVLIAREHDAELLLVDGRRPLVGGAVPRGEVATVLKNAPCDVAVLVERDRVPPLDGERAVVVRFSGNDADQGALELGGRIASGADAPLRVVEPDELESAARGAGLVVAAPGTVPTAVVRLAPTLFVRRADY